MRRFRREYDADEEELIQQTDEYSYLVEGGMKLDDINDALNISLVSEDYDSIGGLIIEHLDRLPEEGETISTENGISLQVKEISQNRIIKVLMVLPQDTSGEQEQQDASEANAPEAPITSSSAKKEDEAS